MLKRFLFTILSLVLLAGCGVDTIKSLLISMTDNRFRTLMPDSVQEYQASSYDRRSIAFDQPGWFTNRDASQYIRTEDVNGHKENVMLDVEGPGAIVRFWLTTFKRNGIIRIYFDNKPEPEITIPAYDLMKIGLPLGRALLQAHSSYEPKEKGGSTLYLPMPYAKHCKVTFEDKDTDNQPRYYQINYVKLNQAKTFSKKHLDDLKMLVDKTNDKLLHPDSVLIGRTTDIDQQIAPNGEAWLTCLRVRPAYVCCLSN
ncbi:DUF2961 domain-containing protein [Mucilaginibacter corticis]|uniref:DUF2961 domain-containing protein n=1 Tax=Mucilaginibacter corticis TaxID=2597670 RepID=A0A556MWV0_9SPHI|nr:DUF2961 domain-containing protein [Mucilaginibacter corticis]TSJ44352.1 DUF2961 domain-containing protein [Mucilaginibacter corticis]